jgi:hypothetical protein
MHITYITLLSIDIFILFAHFLVAKYFVLKFKIQVFTYFRIIINRNVFIKIYKVIIHNLSVYLSHFMMKLYG